MSETREQYRDFLGGLAYDAWLDSDAPTKDSLHGVYCDVGAAVAAQVLLDFRRHVGATSISAKYAEWFARERDIDLDEPEERS